MPSKFGIKSFCRNSGWLGRNSNDFWNLERVKQCAGFLPPCITTNSIWSSVLGLFDFIGFPNTLRQIQNRPQTFVTYKFLKNNTEENPDNTAYLRIPDSNLFGSLQNSTNASLIYIKDVSTWKCGKYVFMWNIKKYNKISNIIYY